MTPTTETPEKLTISIAEASTNYRGMSISDITRKTGISYQAIADIETGFTKGPQFVTLSKICHALRCKVNNVIVNEKE